LLEQDHDPADAYRARLSNANSTAIGVALIGLGETGGPADEAVVRRYLRDARPAVRAGVLLALARFKAEDVAALALAALDDESAVVTRTARDLLVERRLAVRTEDVWNAFARGSSRPGKLAALAVLSRLNYWEAFSALLRAWLVSDGPVKERAALHLARHHARRNRVFDVPSSSVAVELHALLENPMFGDPLRRELRALLEARERRISPAPRSS
jgi:hypothetical protein